MVAAEKIIEVRDLDVSFGRQHVLRDISLEIPTGQSLAIIGESGCGKTVLLKTLIGLIRPTRGCVEFDGQRLDQLSRSANGQGTDPVRVRVSKRGAVRQHDGR